MKTPQVTASHPSDPPARGLRVALWHVVALTIVLFLPYQYWRGGSILAATPQEGIQSGFGGLGYLLAVLLQTSLPVRNRFQRLIVTAGSVGIVFGALWLLPVALPELSVSRALLGLAGVLSLAFSSVLELLPATPLYALAPMVLVAAGTLEAGRRSLAEEDFTVDTEFYLLQVGVHRSPELAKNLLIEGGGLTRLGSDMLLATGAGRFYRVRWPSHGEAAVEPLSLPSPANRQEFIDGVGPGIDVNGFRVVDLIAEAAGDSVVFHVMHHYWRAAERCYVLRVSTTTADAGLTQFTPWRALFDGQPCLPIKKGERGTPFTGQGGGGRMLRLPEGLLVSSGDFLFDGFNSTLNLPRDSTSHYGKTFLLSEDGTARIVTSGHRNPQGLTIDGSGRLWETEHGPRGGDELNLLEPGADYAWPLRTLGTEYSMREWPLQQPASIELREPVMAFVPSVGISNLIAPSDRRFERWEGDLLIGTLRQRTLYRVHLDGDRPVYSEAIELGFEVRDLEEALDGSLVAWTDQGALLSIRPDESDGSGAALASTCTGCHTLNQGQNGGIGPNLFSVVGRPVAARRGFQYSDALTNLGGRWTPERLDAFLANPQGLAPGTTMSFPGIADADQRRFLIEYLSRPR